MQLANPPVSILPVLESGPPAAREPRADHGERDFDSHLCESTQPPVADEPVNEHTADEAPLADSDGESQQAAEVVAEEEIDNENNLPSEPSDPSDEEPALAESLAALAGVILPPPPVVEAIEQPDTPIAVAPVADDPPTNRDGLLPSAAAVPLHSLTVTASAPAADEPEDSEPIAAADEDSKSALIAQALAHTSAEEQAGMSQKPDQAEADSIDIASAELDTPLEADERELLRKSIETLTTEAAASTTASIAAPPDARDASATIAQPPVTPAETTQLLPDGNRAAPALAEVASGSAPRARLPAEVLIPASDGPRHAIPIDTARLLHRVARAFSVAQQRDSGEIQLRLSPPELGSLRLLVQVQEGALAARVEADSAAARTTLLDNLPALRERLAEQGMRLERFDVDLMQRQPGGTPDRPQHEQKLPAAPRPVQSNRMPSPQPTRPQSHSVGPGRLNVVV